METRCERPVWEIPITKEYIERLAFSQIKAMSIATTRRGMI